MTDTPREQELIVSKQILSIEQTFSTGPIMGHFLRELRDNQRIMALRCRANGRFLLPPREVDAWSLSDDLEWIEVGPEGTLCEFDVVYYASPDPLTGATRNVPYVIGWVILDGVEGLSPLWHLIHTTDIPALRHGLRARAVFAETRTGAMEES